MGNKPLDARHVNFCIRLNAVAGIDDSFMQCHEAYHEFTKSTNYLSKNYFQVSKSGTLCKFKEWN